LKNTDAAIADIAQACGFKSAQYLHTVFRREFGCTPREYQQGGA
jgi:LacI family transcriptional regulator